MLNHTRSNQRKRYSFSLIRPVLCDFFKISEQHEIHSTMILSDCNFRLLKPSKQLYDFLGVYIQSVSEDLFSF